MPVLQHRSLPESVHEILRARILNNEMPAGAPLVELTLAAEFGVSRTTIRTALRELQAERLVDISPRRGTTVIRMSPEASQELCFARFALEAANLDTVLRHSKKELVDDLKLAIDVMAGAAEKGDVVGVVEADTQLHEVIVRAGGNQVITEMWQSLNGQMGALMRSTFDREQVDDLFHAVRWHERLLRGLQRRDAAGATAALHEHYVSGKVSRIRNAGRQVTQ